MKHKNKGSIAFVTVIIVSGLLLVSGVAVILASADVALSAENYSASMRMEATLRTCLEESLFRVKGNAGYTGQVVYTNGSDQCTGDTADDPVGPNIKVITVTATFEEFQTHDVFRVDVSQDPFELLD